MNITFWISDKIKRPKEEQIQSQEFIQKMLNRLGTGFVRYGIAKKEQKYMTRLNLELKSYKRTGNCEHLYNIANYALLESMTPENNKFHFDGSVDSATRGKLGV